MLVVIGGEPPCEPSDSPTPTSFWPSGFSTPEQATTLETAAVQGMAGQGPATRSVHTRGRMRNVAVTSGLRAAGGEDVHPRPHGRLEERRRQRRQAPQRHQVGQPVGTEEELADVDGRSLNHYKDRAERRQLPDAGSWTSVRVPPREIPP